MIVKKEVKASNMTCESCEKIIKKTISKLEGIKRIEIKYDTQEGVVEYDDEKTSFNEIISAVKNEGYGFKEKSENGTLQITIGEEQIKTATLLGGLLLVILGGYIIATRYFQLPELTNQASLTLIFTAGLFTGFHCIGMCGGFVVAYATRSNKKTSHFMYGAGKTLSYTIIGAIFGLIGSIIVFTPLMRGMAAIIAGAFLILYGINNLNLIPQLRKLRFQGPMFLTQLTTRVKTKNPFVIGLLNGLMIACGPLQAMYVFAAGTGSPTQGALSLLAFGLGTLPPMLGFGMFTSFISKNTAKTIVKASGVIVIALGFIMLNTGLALTGVSIDLKTTASSANQLTGLTINNGYQEIYMNVTRNGWEPATFTIKKGVPVKWIVNGKEITSCNRAIQVPKLGLYFDVKKGEQVIEFTPKETGNIPFTCWMGMIRGNFKVVE